MSRKQEIIETAAQMFREKGYRATTLQDVADQLHFTKATLYYYLKSKEELLFEMYDQAMNLAWASLDEIVNTDLPSQEKIRLIMRSYLRLVIDELPLFTVFFKEKSELPPDKYESHSAREKEYLRQIERLFDQGIAEGAFVPMDSKMAVQAMVGMSSWLYKWYKPTGRLSAEEIADSFYQILSKGFLVDK